MVGRWGPAALLLFFLSCVPEGPVVVKPGQERCAHCRMDVVDMRFNTQLITAKGRRYHFDSIECMEAWMLAHPDQKVAHAYVKNAVQSDLYLERKQARYVRSEEFPSPMGAYLAAYETEEQVSTAIAQYGGHEVNLDELKHIVQEWQQGREHDQH